MSANQLPRRRPRVRVQVAGGMSDARLNKEGLHGRPGILAPTLRRRSRRGACSPAKTTCPRACGGGADRWRNFVGLGSCYASRRDKHPTLLCVRSGLEPNSGKGHGTRGDATKGDRPPQGDAKRARKLRSRNQKAPSAADGGHGQTGRVAVVDLEHGGSILTLARAACEQRPVRPWRWRH